MYTRALPLLALLLLVACESATTPDASAADPEALADQVLATLSDGTDAAAGEDAPLLHRLLRRALGAAAEEHGPEAARTAAAHLREQAGAVRSAREAGDREAWRRAVEAFESAEAGLVIRVLGTGPVTRVLRSDQEALDALRQRAERLEAAGEDARPARRVLAAAVPDFRLARQAWAADDPVTALRLGARVHDLLHRAR